MGRAHILSSIRFPFCSILFLDLWPALSFVILACIYLCVMYIMLCLVGLSRSLSLSASRAGALVCCKIVACFVKFASFVLFYKRENFSLLVLRFCALLLLLLLLMANILRRECPPSHSHNKSILRHFQSSFLSVCMCSALCMLVRLSVHLSVCVQRRHFRNES